MPNPMTADRAVNDLLERFFRALDDKHWSTMRQCLSDRLITDDASCLEVPAPTISASLYVEQRRFALQALDIRHNFFNLRVELDGENTASARCNYIIHRSHSLPRGHHDYFHSYGHCWFGFARFDGHWKISRITQRVVPKLGRLGFQRRSASGSPATAQGDATQRSSLELRMGGARAIA
jgi:SnoaL-like domain